MTALRRAFLAVVPPPPVLRWTESVAGSARGDPAGDGLRWTRTDQRHLTLQFLGAVPDVDPIAESVAASVRRVPAFPLALGGAGAFPSERRASVLWLGVREGADALAALAAAVADATTPFGVEPDDRPYRAHLTLARSNRTRDLRTVVGALDAVAASPAWSVGEVVLFDSTASKNGTGADGVVHTEHARFGLAG